MLAPNAVTAMALCFGLTGVRYGISGDWERAVLSILFAGVLDGLDGRIARMLRGESRLAPNWIRCPIRSPSVSRRR
jgi:CDP-diacylglycerol--serine O-phosphatidyltransferase